MFFFCASPLSTPLQTPPPATDNGEEEILVEDEQNIFIASLLPSPNYFTIALRFLAIGIHYPNLHSYQVLPQGLPSQRSHMKGRTLGHEISLHVHTILK
jgi:hypothetical protein